jgi:D-beta-D-heptose 7-phosphate kinase/D-beta-D-heptose 1-phosphate adenosyltransferase
MNELLNRQFDYRPKIAVVGDAILDEYYNVDASRVSPEFPIPILHSHDGKPYRISLGGAANVCFQFSNFNFDINLFALINERIKDIAVDFNLGGSILAGTIPVKKRFSSNGFPLCRIDVEDKNYCLKDIEKNRRNILANLYSSGPFDVVVFSDYNKGLFDNSSNFIGELGDSVITIVDPKKGPLDKWKGCSIIKPNSKEAKDISNTEDPVKQCEFFLRGTDCQAVIITQGASGVFGNVMGQWFEYRPLLEKRAKSVIGAGDCFVAFLAMCMAHSIDIKKAVEIAFEACSVYVDNLYNAPIHPYQISDKFINPKNLFKRNFSLVFTNGCFDILHPGHIKLLQFAKTKADKLVVALNSDESVRKQKKNHPLVNNLDYRKLMISSLECVDFVVHFEEDTPYELIDTIRPDVLVKGSDWPVPVGSDIVPEHYSFDIIENYSTSSIIEKIKKMNT